MLKEIQLQYKPKLIISNKVQGEIFYLHSLFGNTEWSGILWLEVNGTITKPDELILKAIDFSLLDLGEPAYTEFELGTNVVDIYIEKPELMGKKISTLHTHHNMKVFFSGTDIKQLHEQAPCHNYYVSTIVNKDCNIISKIAYIAENENNISYKDDEGKIINLKSNEKVICIMDCEIIFESDNYIIADKLKKDKELKKTLSNLNFHNLKNNKYEYQDLFDNDIENTKTFQKSEEEQFLIDLFSLDIGSDINLKNAIKTYELFINEEEKNIVFEDLKLHFKNCYEYSCSEPYLNKINFYNKCIIILNNYNFKYKTNFIELLKDKLNLKDATKTNI